MGRFHSGPPLRLLRLIRNDLQIAVFVETGTYCGTTAAMASRLFDKVYTIEAEPTLYSKSCEELGDLGNTQCILGDSAEVLPSLVGKLSSAAVFWLDAHWCGDSTAGMGQPCPLIQEIHAINQSSFDHCILIDDAHCVTSPPGDPDSWGAWPNLTETLSALNSAPRERYIVVVEDVLISVPVTATNPMAKYCQDVNKQILRRIYA